MAGQDRGETPHLKPDLRSDLKPEGSSDPKSGFSSVSGSHPVDIDKSVFGENMISELLKDGPSFSFLQIIRLLRRLGSHHSNGNTSTKPEITDNVRIRPKLNLSFPPADVDKVEKIDGEKSNFLITATFLGLYGTSSPLPSFYTEDLLDEESREESVSRDFIDIINHRLFSLLFDGWLKYKQFLQIAENENNDYLERLFCLIGLGEKVVRSATPDSYKLLRYIGILSQQPRSALGLTTLLSDALEDIPIELIPCVKRKATLPPDQKFSLGTANNRLGMDAYLGDQINDRMGKFRLKIGPMNEETYREFFPGKEKYKKLVALTKIYLTDPLEYDIELILSQGNIKTTCLGGPKWSGLGLDTWLFSEDNIGEIKTIIYPE